jgi:hypothetical protein
MKRIKLLFRDNLQSGATSARRLNPGEMGFLDLIPVILKRWKLMIAVVGVAVAGAVVLSLLMPNTYRSAASILPTGEVDQLSDLRSLVGIGTPATAKLQNSSMLFSVILQSNAIRDAVTARTYTVSVGGVVKSIKLAEYFNVDNPDRLRDAVGGMTSIAMDKKNGVIAVEAETEIPQLSQAVLQAYMEELEAFNLLKRRSQAYENAEYVSRQMLIKEAALRIAEDSLEEFRKVNAGWITSDNAELMKIVARMQRVVDVLTQGYLYLRQQYDIALFEAEKDVPIVRTLDSPSLPTVKSGPKRLFIVLSTGAAAFFAAILWILILDVRYRKTDPTEEVLAHAELRADTPAGTSRALKLVSGSSRQETAIAGGEKE